MPVRRADSMLSNLLARLGVQRWRPSSRLRRRRATAAALPEPLHAEISLAEEAAARGDWPRALGIWSALAPQCPGAVAPAIGRGIALVELDRLDEAEAVFAEAAEDFPDDPQPLLRHGWVAVRRGDWPEALRRSQALRQLFPDLAEGHIGVGEALRQTGRLSEAETILAAASARFHATPWPAILHAQVAVSRGDWSAAASRWEEVRRRFPRELAGYVGAAEAYLQLAQPTRADAALLAASGRVAGGYAAALDLAQAALRLQRWEVAAGQWQAVLQQFPDEHPDFIEAVDALQAAGRLAEADAVAHSAARRFPTCEAAWLAAIRSALAQQERPEALRRWREMVRHLPAPSAGFLPQREDLRKQLALSTPGFAAASLDLERWVPATVICEDPVIILSANLYFEVVEYTAPYYRDRPVYFFSGMLWTLSRDPNYRRTYKEKFEQLAREYPNFKITALANDVAELLELRDLGVPAELVNHNAFIDDTVFDILPVPQTFDAIYNARLGGYKRHSLARDIGNLKLIVTGPTPENLEEARQLLPGCTIANETAAGIVHLSPHEVAGHLNTAKCGLCLSPYEGAMFASAEYLLCGLPVVTTRNSGGRNWFFSNDYVITCDDDPAAVAAAVEQLCREPVSRQLVRESARQKMRRDRFVFFDLVDRVFRELGQETRHIEAEFDKRFFDKLNYTGRRAADLLVP